MTTTTCQHCHTAHADLTPDERLAGLRACLAAHLTAATAAAEVDEHGGDVEQLAAMAANMDGPRLPTRRGPRPQVRRVPRTPRTAPAVPEAHRGTWMLNPAAGAPGMGGLRFVLGCSCGEHPAKAPARRGAAETRWHDAHRRRLGLPVETSSPVYGPGAAAAGLTWDQWREAGNTTDPWTGQAR